MNSIEKRRPRAGELAAKTDGNPDGKGANGFMLDWYESSPRGVVAKPRRQVLAEFFTSMLVLSAKFKYKPTVGGRNYLYWVNGEWSLSLIAPDEWSQERRDGFAGTCVLQSDRTWTIEPSANLAERNPVSDAAGRFYDAFNLMLSTDLTLEEILPFCVWQMPYYQRLNANALSRSIRSAIILGDQTAISCRQWQLLLPRLDQMLLSHGA